MHNIINYRSINSSIFPLILLLIFSTTSSGIDKQRWIININYSTKLELELIKSKFDHFNHHPAKNLVILDVGKSEFDWLKNHRFSMKINEPKTANLNTNLAINSNAQNFVEVNNTKTTESIPGFSCYRTVEETFNTAESLVASYPNLAEWNDIGDSWEKTQNISEGYDIKVLKISNTAVTGDKPPLIVTSGIHAREYTNSELVTRFAEKLLNEYGENPDITWLVDHHEIHLILNSNPDGRKKAETGLSWRKNTNNNFCSNSNNRGIDLNRNFNFQWDCCGGSSTDPCSTSFRGPSSSSEPETQSIIDYLSLNFDDQRDDDLISVAPLDTVGVYLDIHSYGQVILSSWGFSSTPPPNGDGILSLARKFAYFNNYAPQLGSLGTVDGSTKDFAYGRFGVPGYTIELGTEFFEECDFFENSIVDSNIDTLIYAAKASRKPYTIPLGPDSTPYQLNIPHPLGANVSITAFTDDTRYTNGTGIEPTQTINAAEITINTPPWAPSASPISMQAVDGSYDDEQETVNANVNTGNLELGRNLVFIRAKDSEDNWGAVSSVYLDLIDPNIAPTILGTVSDINTGAPIQFAQIKINSYQIETDANGQYSLQLPVATYDMVVTIDGYLSEQESEITVINSQSSQHDFELVPLVNVYTEYVETGSNGWSADSSWAITNEKSASPTHSWADSPGSNYPDNADFSLTSPVINLIQLQDPILTFKHTYDFESGFDYGLLEISTDAGGNWQQVTSYNGRNTQWSSVELALPQLSNSNAMIRFRVTSDSSVNEDGWHIDDVIILAPFIDTGVIFSNGFE